MALHVAIAARDDAGDARWLSLGTEGDEAAIRLLAGVVKERELLVLELVDARAQLYSLRAGGSDRCLSASLESLSLAVAPRRLPPPREQLWTLEATADGRRTLRAAVDGTLVAPAADGRGLVRGAAAGARPFTFSVVVGAVLGAVSASAQRAMDGAELALWSAATQRWVSLRPTHLFGFGGEATTSARFEASERLTLRVVDAASGRVALRSAHGSWLCAEPDGRLVANRPRVDAWETFTVTRAHGGAPCDVSFATAAHGSGAGDGSGGGGGSRFIGAHAVGAPRALDAASRAAGPFECFTLIDAAVARRAYAASNPSIALWGGGAPADSTSLASAVASIGSGLAAVASALATPPAPTPPAPQPQPQPQLQPAAAPQQSKPPPSARPVPSPQASSPRAVVESPRPVFVHPVYVLTPVTPVAAVAYAQAPQVQHAQPQPSQPSVAAAASRPKVVDYATPANAGQGEPPAPAGTGAGCCGCGSSDTHSRRPPKRV